MERISKSVPITMRVCAKPYIQPGQTISFTYGTGKIISNVYVVKDGKRTSDNVQAIAQLDRKK